MCVSSSRRNFSFPSIVAICVAYDWLEIIGPKLMTFSVCRLRSISRLSCAAGNPLVILSPCLVQAAQNKNGTSAKSMAEEYGLFMSMTI